MGEVAGVGGVEVEVEVEVEVGWGREHASVCHLVEAFGERLPLRSNASTASS